MSHRTLRDQIEELDGRLLGIGARAIPLHELASAVREGQVPPALLDYLEEIDRDLMLATHALDLLRERTEREAQSLAPAGDRRGPDDA